MKKDKIEIFNRVFSMPMAAAMCGFGFFWLYRLLDWNVWISMIVGLYASALMSLQLRSK